MVNIETFRQQALAFPEVTEEPHFEKTSFRVKKKIFATLNLNANRACLKLSLQDQDLFGLYDKRIVYPVPNKWGQSGWTLIELANVPEEMLADALKAAYIEVAPKKLSDLIVE
ncbi:MAG: MmcQ/YjbR family DNA-binding protein [Cyclobacteriaceae bacterium]